MTISRLKCRMCDTFGFWTQSAMRDGALVHQDLPGDCLLDQIEGKLVCGRCGYRVPKQD